MSIPTYKELLERYPLLALEGPHENVVMAAYCAGWADRLQAEIEVDIARAARRKIRSDAVDP